MPRADAASHCMEVVQRYESGMDRCTNPQCVRANCISLAPQVQRCLAEERRYPSARKRGNDNASLTQCVNVRNDSNFAGTRISFENNCGNYVRISACARTPSGRSLVQKIGRAACRERVWQYV